MFQNPAPGLGADVPPTFVHEVDTRSAALTCPEAQVFIVLGTELLQQGQKEDPEGVLDPEHRAVAPHGGEHDQPSPAALRVDKIGRLSSWNGALLRDAHLAAALCLLPVVRGVPSGRLVLLGGLGFSHLGVTLSLAGGAAAGELLFWDALARGSAFSAGALLRWGGAPGKPALAWNRSLARLTAPRPFTSTGYK